MAVKLTPKQKIFIEEYLIDLNATQAAIRAGYSPVSANQTSSEIMAKPNIRACIDAAIAERSRRTGITADRVLRELARVAFVNPTDFINTIDATIDDGASEDDTAAIAGVKVKISSSENSEMVEREVKLNDKLKALDMLGKHLGMWENGSNQSGEAVTINDDR